MAISIQDLGITQEELISRVVDQLCESTLTRARMDHEGNEHSVPSEFHRQIKELIKQRIDTKINELAEIHILPKVSTKEQPIHAAMEEAETVMVGEWGARKERGDE